MDGYRFRIHTVAHKKGFPIGDNQVRVLPLFINF